MGMEQSRIIEIFNRIGGRSKPPIPPLPNNRRVVLPRGSDQEDMDTDVPPETVGELSRSVFITYQNKRGVVSQRRISISGISRSKRQQITIQAYCHETFSPRSFSLDRIKELIDTNSGEIFTGESISAALMPSLNHDGALKEAISRAYNGIVILSYLAKCDGFYHPNEEDVIMHYLAKVCFDLNFDSDGVIQYIRSFYPTRDIYKKALKNEVSKGKAEIDVLIKYAVRLIYADYIIDPEEQKLLDDIRDTALNS